jgi:cytochrome c553
MKGNHVTMKNPWILPAAALAIGAAGGFITGRNNSPAGSDAAETSETSTRSRSSSRAELDGDANRRSASRTKGIEDIYRTPGQNNRIQALLDFYAGLTPEQLEAEAAKLESLPFNERLMASILLFGRWAEVDPTAAMAYSNTMGFAGGFVRPTILQSWASSDPANAAKYYAENPGEFAMMGMMGGGRGPGGGQSAAGIIAAEWARQDPSAALAWASSLEGREKGSAMESVVREVANTDPRRAAEMASTMDEDSRDDAYAAIAERWATTNFSEAETWIKTLSGEEQSEAMGAALSALARENPALAQEKIASMPEGRDRDRAMASIASQLSRNDPQAAATWLASQTITDGEAQRDAMRDVMSNWTNQDSAGALAFVQSQPAGEARDSATTAYIWNARNDDPATLIQLAESISDEGSRARTVGMTAMRWMQQDAEGARAYIENSTVIPEDMKERLTNGRGFGRGPGGGGGR